MFTIPRRDGLLNITDTEIEGKGNTSLSIISESESKNTEKELNQALLDFRKNIDENKSNASIQEEYDKSSKQSVTNSKSFQVVNHMSNMRNEDSSEDRGSSRHTGHNTEKFGYNSLSNI